MTSLNPIGQFTANAAVASWVELKRLRTVILHKEAKIMDLPNLVEFKILLHEDRIFRDYLNVFLNLPIFSRRFTYNKERRYFDIDPPLQSASLALDESSVIAWVHANRLPLFWGSDLHFECRLCQELLQNNHELQYIFSGASDMYEFRRFLFQTEGESACLFWLDVERLKHTQDPLIAEKLGSRIQQLYLRNGSQFSLSDEVKETALFWYSSENQQFPSKRVSNLLAAQNIILESLKSYWCKRYALHLNKSSARSKSGVRQTISNIAQGAGICRKHTDSLHLPRIPTDSGNSGVDTQAKQLSQVNLNSCTLPVITSSGVLRTATKTSSYEGRKMRSPSPLITPSTQSLFHQSVASTHRCNSQPPQCSSPPPNLQPYLCGSLRSDLIANNPLLRHFASLRSEGLKAVHHLLFWQSVESILTQEEMKRWFRKHKHTERTCPYLTYFEVHPIAANLQELLDLFIRERAPHKIDLPREVRQQLCLLLPKGLGHSLLVSAQDRAAEYLMKPWQKFLLHDDGLFMKDCTSPRFQRRFSRSPQHSMRALSREQSVAEQTYSSSNLSCMWKALKLAEAAKYPGICQLPSRRLTGVSLMKPATKSDEDEEDGLSESYSDVSMDHLDFPLNPMVTTVYNATKWNPQRSHRKMICATKPARSCDKQKKPPLPKSFSDVLRDPAHLEFFHHFLLSQGDGAETQLLFWMSVEDMKSSMGNRRTYNCKMRRILKKFFASNATKVLKCDDAIIHELSKKEKVTPFDILTAQAAVVEAMERLWYKDYLVYLSKNEKQEERLADDQTAKKPTVCKERTKGLWSMFTHNVISFRRGLMNPSTAEMFRNYLKREVIKGNTSGHKKVVGTKVVHVTKLLNDLSFWAEVERYKNLADAINATKTSGSHTPEDDILLHKKAHAIINCYIDSAVSPRVQINIQNDLVHMILDNLAEGHIFRGLFHEAALNIFSVLILYWKRFCVERFAPRRKHSIDSSNSRPNHSSTSSPSKSPTRTSRRKKSLCIHWKGDSQLFDGPVLSFSLSRGLRWLKPRLPPTTHCTKMQTVI